MKNWWKSGDPWIWLTASSVSVSLIVVVGLISLIAWRGLGHFWPASVMQATYTDERDGKSSTIIGEIRDDENVSAVRLRDSGVKVEGERVTRYLMKIGNRELFNLDFRWVLAQNLKEIQYPEKMTVIERREWGNFYGYVVSVKENDKVVSEGDAAWGELQTRLQRALKIFDEIRHLEKNEIGTINYGLEQLRLRKRHLELNHDTDPAKQAALVSEKTQYEAQYEQLRQQLSKLYEQINRDSFTMKVSDDRVVDLKIAKVVSVYRPNVLSSFEKISFYFHKAWTFVSDEPREANTEGGIFPAIFGTVMLVFIMSFIVTPFGVIAAVYLREYAKQGFLTRVIRIAVNNLAGVPAIVYGVFGLGFFVYFLGSNIDQLFYPEALPAPTFGTPGILWSALTLAILTVPVVIVSTEEGLSRIPSSIREGSLALGATKAETLWRTVLPMASPAMMTGLILAIARAAGEVAPLMLVGVVKLAPSLVLDGNAPFLHLERKFMHLGFHIYDVGFQSPNVEAARPLVYATSFLLVAVIVLLNLAAIGIRNHLREKYKALEN
ncbi:MAG: phosphate ABC transporter permease PstA [Thiotrichaceae bacterium]|nr:phosphate ABC transporter permease PstA [Thiotrichaceae bacterium]